MSDVVEARSEEDVAGAVAAAAAAGRTLEVVSRASRRGLGRPIETDATLDVSALAGLTLYEPEELVLGARPGTPLADILSLVDGRGQMLAFEPPDLGPLFGHPAGRGSLGGAFATGLSGSRRLSHGAVRDHTLGVRAVSGRGEVFKSGGRVMKNVTGYDLPRMLAGSLGTLAVITEITLKVLPRPAMEETVLVPGLSARAAAEAMSAAMGSSCEVSCAAFLPEGIAARVADLRDARALVALRLEGVPPSVHARRAMLIAVLAPFGGVEVLETEASRGLWEALRDVRPFCGTGERALWRLSTAPTAGPLLAQQLAATLGAEAYCDWAGGLVWLLLPGPAAEAAAVRAALAPHGGHATLIRATPAERAGAAVFQPLEPTLAALTRRVKQSFDPAGVLNPGRMHAGI